METITIPSPSAFLSKSPAGGSPKRHHHDPSVQPARHAPKRPLASSDLPAMRPTEYDGGASGATKPKQSKSRNGCVTCKGKRLKCDETKPSCEQCRKRNVQCGGYSKAFKWRSFEEANFTGKSGPKPKKVSPPPPPRSATFPEQPYSQPNSSTDGPSPSSFTDNWPSPYPSGGGGSSSGNQSVPLSPHFSNNQSNYEPPSLPQNPYPQQPFIDQYGSHHYFETRSTTSDELRQTAPLPPSQTSFRSRSPSLRDILLPGTDMDSPPTYPLPIKSSSPYIPSGFTPRGDVEAAIKDEDDVEEIVRTDGLTGESDGDARAVSTNWSFRLPSASPSSADSSSSSNSSALSPWARPRLAPNSQEMLVIQFDRHTCGILSVKDGPHENPWRTMIWPLAQDSPSLYHAVASLTAFHRSKATPELRVDGMAHMHKSVHNLATSLNRIKLSQRIDRSNIETALATTLVLGFSEGWDQHIKTGMTHLKGAKYFVNQAVARQKELARRGGHLDNTGEWQRLRFLCNTFIYMDVIARLTSREEPDDLGYLENVLTTFNEPNKTLSEIDPLMGAASTLFPLIGRVAAVVTKVRNTTTNSLAVISDALGLKKEIEEWQPPATGSFEVPEDPSSEVQHSIQTAEAYRWATLLYLHQAVPEIPSDPATMLADRVLKLLATVPLSSRTVIIQIYPLMTASCEAITKEDRDWIKSRWAAMSARLSIGNVDKCFEVIREVWARRDVFEAEKADRFLRRQAAAQEALRNGMQPMMPNRGMKRKGSDDVESDNVSMAASQAGSFSKRRALMGHGQLPHSLQVDESNSAPNGGGGDPYSASLSSPLPPHSPVPKRVNDTVLDSMEYEYTVRGRLHWIHVMSGNSWEGESPPLVPSN